MGCTMKAQGRGLVGSHSGVAVLLTEYFPMFRKVVVPPSLGSSNCAVR